MPLRSQIADAAAKERLHHAFKRPRLQQRSPGFCSVTGAGGDAEGLGYWLRSGGLTQTGMDDGTTVADRSVMYRFVAMLHGGCIDHTTRNPLP